MSADVLDDVASELIHAGLDAERVRGVLQRVRVRWAGCDAYIRQRDPSADDVIRKALEAGSPIREVARRVGVSERTVRRRRSAWLD